MDFVQATLADDPEQALWKVLLEGDDRPHGYMRTSTVAAMPWTPDFVVSGPDERPRTVRLVLADPAAAADHADLGRACTAAFRRLIDAAIAAGAFPELRRPRGENFVVHGARYRVAYERAAATLFGFATSGVALAAFVRDPAAAGGLRAWVARRAPTVHLYPGMLDATVTGGVPEGEPLLACIAREAWEETGLPEAAGRTRARSVGVCAFIDRTNSRGVGHTVGLVSPQMEYHFELELAADENFEPRSRDGEAASFQLMDMDELCVALRRGDFNPPCAGFSIAFLIRHGIITPDNESGYAEISARLCRKMPVPTAREW